MLFSQRKGYKSVKNLIQLDGMDQELRNGLWNVLTICYWNQMNSLEYLYYDANMKKFVSSIWMDLFKLPIDTIPPRWNDIYLQIREFFWGFHWYEVYDFIEFVANANERGRVDRNFTDQCNRILEQECSAYRFINGRITEITSDAEIREIDAAIEGDSSFRTVEAHIRRALDLMADRKNPDYRNSIKESISAVEAICKFVVGDSKATLGTALQQIEKKGRFELHKALKDAFSKLYGYTNDADGIRHALIDEPNISFEDAKFMLVSCSAFVNYIKDKYKKGRTFF